MANEYTVKRDFQIGDYHVLELDRDFDSFGSGIPRALIDGKIVKFTLNSIRNWIIIRQHGSYAGKTVTILD
ncbi:MAG: hypothetical protein II875_04350 [Clostridia bacterium]|nr:hypothetical protein [Clostridia bacterium]